jgi:RNA polymerase sigma-70 factor (ECF subfamily)
VSDREPTDADLLQALRHDPEAVGILYDRYARRLVRHLRQEGATHEIALDAAQEVFARLILHRRRVRPGADGAIWSWLAVTARNLLRDWQRRQAVDTRARRRLGLPVEPDEAGEARARMDAARLRPTLGLALDRLTPEQRTAVRARVIDELDYPEIAVAVGESEATVRRRVSRGLRAMQTFLQGGSL